MILDAARFAPSSYNEQEWRFVWAHRNKWHKLFSFLHPANQEWCFNASHLVLVCARNNYTKNNTPNRVSSFDAGLAVQNMLLQAHLLGIGAHVMGGFDFELARSELKIPDDFDVLVMIAFGVYKETGEEITNRKSIDEISREGEFSFER
jgi:nitroreductase